MRRVLLVILLNFLLYPLLFSQQIREFSVDTLTYIHEFKSFMNGLDEEKMVVVDQFVQHWQADAIEYEEKLRIISLSNLMLKRQAKPFPHFYNYFILYLMNFTGEQDGKNIDKLLSAFEKLVADKTIQFRETERILQLAIDVIRNDDMYNLAGINWKALYGDYNFDDLNGKPVVVYENTDLLCFSNRDTLKILRTSGIYDLLKTQWVGKGGMVSWEKAGFGHEEVYAELGNYSFDASRAQYNADSVTFHYKKYFDYPLEGSLEDKAMPIINKDQALYPKFTSYQSKYILPDLFKGIEFIGGLAMAGAKLVGTGLQGDPAILNIFEHDTLRMKVLTQNILIKENSMNSMSVNVRFYLDGDSIYHPDLQFLYTESTDEIRLTKGDGYTSGVPFRNSYHKVDMNFEELMWKRGTGILKIQPSIGRSVGQASFESDNFFNYANFEEIQGRDYINPLVSLWQFSRQVNNLRQFPVTAYAGNIGMADYQVRHQLMKLSRMGFLFFDEERDLIRLNDKLFYYLDASVGRTDYDVIFFVSKVEATHENAILNLENNDLTIFGIPQIFLSDSQSVVLTPTNNQITLKRNRNFQFDGMIRAGLFNYYGNNFFFNYDSFKINLQDIDSLQLQVAEVNTNTGVKSLKVINNKIENITGELLIDHPENKSGLEDYPEYPMFTSRENSYVYFDEPSIQKGVYTKEDVYFELFPFSIDSLDNFTRQGMRLEGQFISGGMLPPLEQTLSLMDDNSLGFIFETTESGIPVYNGKGTLYNTIQMSSQGLHASGRLDYITSTTWSDNFLLHPDSLMTYGREFEVRKQIQGTQFPEAGSENVNIKWLPGDEKFYANRTTIPFTMFNDTVQLIGNLLLEPEGLSGNGTMDLISSSLRSDEFKYLADNILADTSDFKLNSLEKDQLAISTDNIRANINFKTSMGEFFANDDYTRVNFQAIRYISDLDYFQWDIENETISMGLARASNGTGPAGDDGLSGPRYISIHPLQDSLSFVSTLASYDYRKEELVTSTVPYIQVADSRIFPHEGVVRVRTNAAMQKLSNAIVQVNYKEEKYTLYEGNISIQGKNNYTGNAYFDYVDMTDKAQKIAFHTILVDSTGQTIATGEISRNEGFHLSPFFEYQGKYQMEARKDYLYFDGSTRLTHACGVGKGWLKFKADINPDSVMIPVAEQAMDADLKPLYFGTMISRDSTHIYSAFASARKDYFDSFITTSHGFLSFNPAKQQYELSSPEKLNDPSIPGNFLALKTDSCEIYGEGQLNFQVNYGQLQMKTPGVAVHKYNENKFSTEIMMALKFHFSADALSEFSRELDSIPGLKPYDISEPFYRKSLAELVGQRAAERMDADMGLYGELRTIPEEFKQTLIFSGVKLDWDQISRTFRYHGDVAIVRVGERQINKKVEAYIELTKRTSGDLLDIYLKVNNRTWYYFGYNPGSLQTISTNRKYNQIVLDIKDSERKVKTRIGETGFIYSAAADRRAQLFLRRFMAGEDGELPEEVQ